MLPNGAATPNPAAALATTQAGASPAAASNAPAGAAAPNGGAQPGANGANSAGADEAKAQRFAEVTRLQTRNLQLERELGTTRQKLEGFEKAGGDLNKLKAEAKSNPLKVMKEFGLTFKDVAEFVINSKDGAPDPVAEELRELKEWRKSQEQREAEAAKEREKTEFEAQVKEAKTGIQGVIDTGLKVKGADGVDTVEPFELLKVYQTASGETGADLVWQIMVEHWEQNGTALDASVAAQHAEAWLGDYAEKLAGTGKVQTRLKAKAEAAAKAAAEAQAAAKASGKGAGKPTDAKKPGATLTNRDTAATSGASADDEIATALPGTLAWDKRIERVAAKYPKGG